MNACKAHEGWNQTSNNKSTVIETNILYPKRVTDRSRTHFIVLEGCLENYCQFACCLKHLNEVVDVTLNLV